MTPSKNGPQLTWTNIIATLGFGTVLMGAFMGAFWTVFQTQFSNIERRLDKADIERQHFVSEKEHIEFRKRLDDAIAVIQNQLLRIEQTRPTTGELQAVGSSTANQATKVEDRVRSLEDYLRTTRPLPTSSGH